MSNYMPDWGDPDAIWADPGFTWSDPYYYLPGTWGDTVATWADTDTAWGEATYYMPSDADPPVYRVESRGRDGSLFGELPFRDLQFEVMMNKPSDFRFKVPMREGITKEILEAGLHEIWIWRNDALVKAGPLWNVSPNSGEGDMNCSGTDLLDYFDVLRVNAYAKYAAMDQFDVVEQLLITAQAQAGGDYRITGPTNSSGIVVNRLYQESDGKYVLEAVTDIANEADGFDFWVDPASRRFMAFYPRLSRDLGLRLEYPAGIKSYSANYFGKWMRNDVKLLGPYNRTATAIATTSRTTYGLRQLVESYTDAPDPTALNAKASYTRDLRQAVKVSPNISLEPSYLNIFDSNTVRLGDMIQVVIDDGYVQFNEKLRLIGFQVTVGQPGQESVVLYFNDDREVAEE